MLALAFWIPAGYWTIDDGVKAISATEGESPWGSPIQDGELRSRLSNPADYPVLVLPFAERIEAGVKPGFSPYARLFTRLESWFSRRAMIVVSTAIAVGVGWLLYGAGLGWGFLLLPLTFYGFVPWEHGAALCVTVTALAAVFVKDKLTAWAALASGALLAVAAALRPEHLMLLAAAVLYLLLERRYRDSMLTVIGGAGAGVVLVLLAGVDEVIRQTVLNRDAAGCRISGMMDSVMDVGFAMGPSVVMAVVLCVILLLSLSLLEKENSPRVLRIIGWGGVVLYAFSVVRLVWGSDYPPFAMLATGSFAFAMPWVLWLFVSKAAWNTKAMTYATAVLILGIALLPQSTGVHWGPRLLLFSAPLFLIAFYGAGLHRRKAFVALVVLGLVQTVSSGVLVYARYVETTDHVKLLTPQGGTPMITTTRAQAIDLAPKWQDYEFFTVSTPQELKNLLVEFYQLRQDSAWLHLPSSDSLFIQTFPDNRPVWPHKMSIFNFGSLCKSQWRLYQLVMNRADPAWIPLLEGAADRAMQRGEMKRALFLQDDVLRIDPSRAKAHSNMAVIHAQMGKTFEAKAAAMRALELDSTLSQARELLHRLEAAEAE